MPISRGGDLSLSVWLGAGVVTLVREEEDGEWAAGPFIFFFFRSRCSAD